MARFHRDPAPIIEPLVFPAACLADPVAADAVDEPPMPDAIERPAGQPSATTYPSWLTYEARRRERAELAGLFFQGQRDSYEHAYSLTAEQLRQCVTFSRAHSDAR